MKKVVLAFFFLFILQTNFVVAQDSYNLTPTASVNGYDYVDLALPSGLLWAVHNIGATLPEEKGEYISWGETESKTLYGWPEYKWGESCDKNACSFYTKYTVDIEGADNITVLEKEDDVATARWGDLFRMPTSEDFAELIANTTYQWVELNGIAGALFTSKVNAKSVFFPYIGYKFGQYHNESAKGGFYWSSTLYPDNKNARSMHLNTQKAKMNYGQRREGRGVRAVISTITYKPNGGVGEMPPTLITHGNAYYLSKNAFTRSGYKFVGWNSKPDGTGESYSDQQQITPMSSMCLYAQWEEKTTPDCYEYVDLGLPSGLLWATHNLGATAPEELGEFYAWGETETKTTFTDANYKWITIEGGENIYTKYNDTDGLQQLDLEDDAAHVQWGQGWRMPTYNELKELRANCTFTEVVQNGVVGTLATSKINGNTLFLPYIGSIKGDMSSVAIKSCILTSTKHQSSSPCWYFEALDGRGGYTLYELLEKRSCGFPIRPVMEKTFDKPELYIQVANAEKRTQVQTVENVTYTLLSDIKDNSYQQPPYYFWQKSDDGGLTWAKLEKECGYGKSTISYTTTQTEIRFRVYVVETEEMVAQILDNSLCNATGYLSNEVIFTIKTPELLFEEYNPHVVTCTNATSMHSLGVNNPFDESWFVELHFVAADTSYYYKKEYPANTSIEEIHSIVPKITDDSNYIKRVYATKLFSSALPDTLYFDEVNSLLKKTYSITIDNKDQFEVIINATDNTLTCTNTSIDLVASCSWQGVHYVWNDASLTEGATLSVNTPNIYQVRAYIPGTSCQAYATHTIGINKEMPIVSIASIDANGNATTTLNCTEEAKELTLTASVSNENIIGSPVTFAWQDDATLPAERVVNEAKRYTVIATGANGCPASQYIDIELDDDVPSLTLTASTDTITCAVPVAVLTATATPSQGVAYVWNTQQTASEIQVNIGGEYSVTAMAPNGCQKEASIVIEQRTDEPAVVITAADPKQYCRVNTLTADGAVSYVWSTNETTASIETSAGGMYWVEGTNAYGCSARAELNLENDKEAPVVAISSDINAITCTNDVATLTATITNADDTRTYSYEWSPKSGTNSTLRVTEGKTYKVVVTDGTNYCKGEKTITVAQHTEKPMVDVQTLPAVCLPATIDLSQAIGPNTLADNVVFFEDEALTKEITNTTIDLAQYNVFYVQGQQVNGNGCMGDAQPVAANVKAVTPAPVVKDYDECTKAGSEKFSSLVTSGYYKLNFYASENDEAPIADAFDASQSNTTTTYYVSNTNLGACESQRVPFTVHIEGLVDFEMEVSETEIMIGDDPVTITLIPSSVDVEGYRWMANGKELQVEGDEYTVPVYVDTKFEIAAIGRCNSLTQEASVVVNWPTAFTPYNNNGMNETFAKGLPVLIFNRFGIQVFEGADGWDGVMNKNMGANVMAVPGVYYYAVSLPDGNVKKGTIEVVKF